MRIFSLFLILLFSNIMLSAQNTTEEQKIKEVITLFFEGLHIGDSSLVSKTLDEKIKIQTTFTNKKGVAVLKDQSRTDLLAGIAAKKKTDTYLEKLLSYTIKIDGNLASVWTPYEFYYNGNFSHCGANSFQLFKSSKGWKIIYLVDMRRRGSCTPTEVKK